MLDANAQAYPSFTQKPHKNHKVVINTLDLTTKAVGYILGVWQRLQRTVVVLRTLLSLEDYPEFPWRTVVNTNPRMMITNNGR